MRNFRLVWAVAAMAACFAGNSFSQLSIPDLSGGSGENSTVRFTAELEPADARPGEYVQLRIKAEIDEGWYIYSQGRNSPDPTRVVVQPGPLEPVGNVQQPTPTIIYDKGIEKQIGIYRGEAIFTQTLQAPKNIAPGAKTIAALIHFTRCTSSNCIPNNTAEVRATLNVSAGAPRSAYAESPVPPNVSFTASFEPATARPGEYVQLRIEAEIGEGWHIYGLDGVQTPTMITLNMGELKREGSFIQSAPLMVTKKDDNEKYGIFKNKAVFTQTLFVPSDVPPRAHEVKAIIDYAPCNETQCYPPRKVEQKIELTIQTGEVRAEYAQPTAVAVAGDLDIGDALYQARSQGLLAYIGFAMSMGFLALLTPCVFPMIPITVSFFTKKEGLSRSQGVGQAFIYCLGIMLTFTALGVLLSALFGATSIQLLATNIWVNLFIAVIFIVFALNLFGAFEITVPHWLLNAFGGSKQGVGIAATVMMGLTFSLTTFTCTVPFVGTVLVAASQGDYFWAVVGMLSFSAAFAFPFFFLALFPQLLSSLPKSGGWLNSVKVTMGLLELAAALKFISNIDLVLQWNVLPRELFLAFWIAISLVAAIYLLGKIQMSQDTPSEHLGAPRLIAAISFFAATLYLFTGLMGSPLGELEAFLPPYAMKEDQENVAIHDNWHESLDDALAEAKAINQPVFVDFTGVTCTNCRWMEKNIFTKKEVSALLNEYVGAQIWTDKRDDVSRANREMQEHRFKTTSLPLYVLLTPDDEELDIFYGSTRNADQFKAFLQGGLDAYASEMASSNP